MIKVTTTYNPELLEWKLEPTELFMGRNEYNMRYGIGLTPPDPKNPAYSYFTVMPRYSVLNEFNGEVMICETKSCFQIENFGIAPNFDFLYGLLFKANLETFEIYNLKSKGSNVNHHKVPLPGLSQVYSVINQAISLAYKGM